MALHKTLEGHLKPALQPPAVPAAFTRSYWRQVKAYQSQVLSAQVHPNADHEVECQEDAELLADFVKSKFASSLFEPPQQAPQGKEAQLALLVESSTQNTAAIQDLVQNTAQNTAAIKNLVAQGAQAAQHHQELKVEVAALRTQVNTGFAEIRADLNRVQESVDDWRTTVSKYLQLSARESNFYRGLVPYVAMPIASDGSIVERPIGLNVREDIMKINLPDCKRLVRAYDLKPANQQIETLREAIRYFLLRPEAPL